MVVAGDSWAMVTVPIIEHHPWTYVLFLGVLVTVSFAIMNLMLAVIVDSAQEARRLSDWDIAMQKEAATSEAKDALTKICEEIDEDGSGSLCLQELFDGYDNHLEFQRCFRVMDIGRDDVGVVFSILDNDSSGSVDYHEFVNELYRMKSHDIHTMLVFIKHYVTELDHKITNTIKSTEVGLLEHMDANPTAELEAKGTSDKLGAPPISFHGIAQEPGGGDRNQKLKDSPATLEVKDALPEMRQAHDELVRSTQGMLDNFGAVLQQQQATLRAPSCGLASTPFGPKAAADAATSGDARGKLHGGFLLGGVAARDGHFVPTPSTPVAAARADEAVADRVELALPPWPRESRPTAPGCCSYAGPKDN